MVRLYSIIQEVHKDEQLLKAIEELELAKADVKLDAEEKEKSVHWPIIDDERYTKRWWRERWILRSFSFANMRFERFRKVSP